MALLRRDTLHHTYADYLTWPHGERDELEGGRYGQAAILELKGRTPTSAIPGVSIDWDRLPPTLP